MSCTVRWIEPVSHNSTRKKDTLSFCDDLCVCCGHGPDVPALRWYGSAGVGLNLPIAVGARPLSALPGGALGLQTLFPDVPSPLVRPFPVAESGAPEHSHIVTGACSWGFTGVLFKSFKSVSRHGASLTKNDLRKFRVSIDSSESSPSPWSYDSDCQNRGYWRMSRQIHYQRSGVWNGSSRSVDLNALSKSWTISWTCTWTWTSVTNVVPSSASSAATPQVRAQQAPDWDCWFWKTAVTMHKRGSSHHRRTETSRVSHAVSLDVDLSALLLVGSSAESRPVCTVWQVTSLSEWFASLIDVSRPCPSDASPRWWHYRDPLPPRTNGRRWVLPVTRTYSAWPSVPRSIICTLPALLHDVFIVMQLDVIVFLVLLLRLLLPERDDDTDENWPQSPTYTSNHHLSLDIHRRCSVPRKCQQQIITNFKIRLKIYRWTRIERVSKWSRKPASTSIDAGPNQFNTITKLGRRGTSSPSADGHEPWWDVHLSTRRCWCQPPTAIADKSHAGDVKGLLSPSFTTRTRKSNHHATTSLKLRTLLKMRILLFHRRHSLWR